MAKISDQKTSFQSNSDKTKSLQFGVADNGMIIEILRNRLYQNKVQTPIQEYICNGRDACRESGSSRPIEVTFPSVSSPEFVVRDYGIGVSPERMGNVFVMYGASTKRHSNSITGMFGIGAKSCFAYTDSFNITTFIDGIKRDYVAHIAATQNGQVDLISETETLEPNGTKISYIARRSDQDAFAKAIIRSTMFWNDSEYPVFHNVGTWQSALDKARAIGTARFMGSNFSGLNANLGQYEKTMIIIDGVPYEMPNIHDDNLSAIKNSGNSQYLNIFIPNGLVSVSASREKIDDSETSKAAFKQIFTAALAEFKKAKEKWEDTIVDIESLMNARERSCGFNLGSDQTFDFVRLTPGGYKFTTSLNVPLDDGTIQFQKLFNVLCVNKFKGTRNKEEFQVGGKSKYYMRRVGAVKQEAIRKWLLSAENTEGIDKIHLANVTALKDIKEIVVDPATGTQKTVTVPTFDKDLHSELISSLERIGFKDIEELIPKPIRVKTVRAKKPLGNIMILDEHGDESTITVESLDEVEQNKPWIYFAGAKASREYDTFKNILDSFKSIGSVENGFRVITSNLKHIKDDKRFIEYSEFTKNWTPSDKDIYLVAKRDFKYDYRKTKIITIHNLISYIDDKNHVLYKYSKNFSKEVPYINNLVNSKASSSKLYSTYTSHFDNVSSILDKYMPFAEERSTSNSDHMREYIKWSIDRMNKDGIIISLPDILLD